jgi:hypothetical protein
MFENIECEWPLFFCYLTLDYCFQGNKNAVTEYTEALEEASLYQQSLHTFCFQVVCSDYFNLDIPLNLFRITGFLNFAHLPEF